MRRAVAAGRARKVLQDVDRRPTHAQASKQAQNFAPDKTRRNATPRGTLCNVSFCGSVIYSRATYGRAAQALTRHANTVHVFCDCANTRPEAAAACCKNRVNTRKKRAANCILCLTFAVCFGIIKSITRRLHYGLHFQQAFCTTGGALRFCAPNCRRRRALARAQTAQSTCRKPRIKRRKALLALRLPGFAPAAKTNRLHRRAAKPTLNAVLVLGQNAPQHSGATLHATPPPQNAPSTAAPQHATRRKNRHAKAGQNRAAKTKTDTQAATQLYAQLVACAALLAHLAGCAY